MVLHDPSENHIAFLFHQLKDHRFPDILCRSKADRAVHIAALCHFQYHTTAFSFMLLTESTIIRAGFLFDFRIYRSLRRQVSLPRKDTLLPFLPRSVSETFRGYHILSPDKCHLHRYIFSRKYFHTYRAYTFVLPSVIIVPIFPVLSVFLSLSYKYLQSAQDIAP